MTTALKAAFEAAGYQSARAQLVEIGLKAMVKHPNDADRVLDDIWQQARRSAPLMEELFKNYRQRALGALIENVRTDLADSGPLGQLAKQAGPPAPIVASAKVVDITWRKQETAAARKWQKQWHKDQQEAADRKHRAKCDEYIQNHFREHYGHIRIEDALVCNVSVAVAEGWVSNAKRDARFVELLTAGVPRDGGPIGMYHTITEVDEFWRLAVQGA